METAKQSDTESDTEDEDEKEKQAGPVKDRCGPQECLHWFISHHFAEIGL